MSATPQPHEDPSGEDVRLADLLDRYVESLQRVDHGLCTTMTVVHPQLAEYVDCLQGLERIAPPATAALRRTAAVSDQASEGSQLEMFGKFELIRELGRGGMGVVYLARQTDLKRMVAVKMVMANRFASQEQLQRFQSEARLAASVRHPHVVGIHEIGDVCGQHYFAMEFVPGPNLAERLSAGPLDPEQAARCMSTIARAVAYLHRHDILHRDLKPSNILFDEQDEPCVTDFGLAKLIGGSTAGTQSGAIVGTPTHMSPEQAAGRTSEISVRSDVYSLGAILYEMLTGRPPFREATPLDTLVQVIEGEPTLPSRINRSIPGELELIVLRCLEKNPQRRYGSADELADDLDRFVRGEPITARPSGLVDRVRRWGRREPALVSRLAALALTALIVQVQYQWSNVAFVQHLLVMSVFGVWAAASFLFPWLLKLPHMDRAGRYLWMAADAMLLTTVLYLTPGPLATLLVGYPLLIAAAGLFFQVRLVAFMTLASVVAYAGLLLLRPELALPAHHPVIFATVLVVLGFVVGYQVFRVRALSRFYEHRPLGR